MKAWTGFGIRDSGFVVRGSRILVLSALMAIGTLSVAATSYQQPPAPPLPHREIAAGKSRAPLARAGSRLFVLR